MANQFDILDKTEGGWGYTFGKFDSNPIGMIFHHTAGSGRATADQVIKYFRQSRFPTQFVIDRDGVVHRALPEGARGQHIKDGWGPTGTGKSNANMEGVELIAKDDKDVTPAQVAAARELYAQRANRWGWDPTTSAFGHGEVNPGHRQDTEGMTVVNAIRGAPAGTAAPAVPVAPGAPTPPVVAARPPVPLDRGAITPLSATNVPAQPGRTGLVADPGKVIGQPIPLDGPPNQLRGAPIPNPFVDKTTAIANKYGIPHSVFENLLRAESGFNPRITGAAGEMGLGQLAPGTAKGLGVTDGYDIDQNLDASGRYLADQYKRTGTWSKAVSAYNRGPAGAEKSGYSLDRYARSPAGQYLIDSLKTTDAGAVGGPSGLEIKPTARAYPMPGAISPDPLDPEPQPLPKGFGEGKLPMAGDPTPQDQKPPGFRPSAPGEGTPGMNPNLRNLSAAQMLMALMSRGQGQQMTPAQMVPYDAAAIAAAAPRGAVMGDPWIAGAPGMRVRVGRASNKAMQTVE